MEENYVKVDVREYVNEGITSGKMEPREAVKYARIVARQGSVGDEVITWSVDEAGTAIVEKSDTVSIDAKTGNPGWIVTKVDEAGVPIVDQNGHKNEWIIEDSKFTSKYEVDPENESLYKPKGGPQMFVLIPENIILEQWGSEMKIARGGYINITDPNDMYGISKRDFEDTYKFSDELESVAKHTI